ncbi:MAG: gamma carbonic anhydrase family protein [Planctomycetaceae bacterium]|nr:MAG: gamma carbonic anhydrase family protein [Planctomycetaceae bacterium]
MTERSFDVGDDGRRIDETAWVAPNATLRGSVRMGAGSSVWFGAVVRGDVEPITIGPRSNVQDLAVIHCDPGFPCEIGEDVTIGHAAVVHGAIVESGSLIGIRAVVLNGARIGSGSIIGAGAVITERAVIPPGSLVVGVPGKVIRPTSPEQREQILQNAAHYVTAAAAYRDQTTR